MSHIEIYRAAYSYVKRQGGTDVHAAEYAGMVADGELPVLAEILNG